MAKLRSNHNKTKAGESGSMIAKVGIFSLVLGALFFFFNKSSEIQPVDEPEIVEEDVEDLEDTGIDSIFYLPTSTSGNIVRHKYYALSYLEKYELAEWVAFELTSDRLSMPWVERTNDFREDPYILTESASPSDYWRTDYDRGHLVAAADMSFSTEAVSETFYMSNIAPQNPGFNKGIWRELEELTRDWARRFKHLYVVTGPLFNSKIKFWIGDNQVAVPPAFYKVILDLKEPELKAIAFIIPNEKTDARIETFATSIDVIEEITGIDFFVDLMPKPLEESLESDFDMQLWKTDERKYQIRVQEWNYQ